MIVNALQWRSQKFSTGGASIRSIPFCPLPFSCPTNLQLIQLLLHDCHDDVVDHTSVEAAEVRRVV